jgi:uncharacterized protein
MTFPLLRPATLAFALLAAATAAAQQPAIPPPPPPITTQPTPSHLAAGREVALHSGITRSFDAILPQFVEQVKRNAVTRPELTKDLNEVLDALKPELELQKQVMVNAAAKVFAGRLSEADLKEVATFFKSPVGQRYVGSQPIVLDELVVEMQTWSQNVAEYIQVRVRAEMGKRGHAIQ